LNTAELHRLCGIDVNVTKSKEPSWETGVLRFLGAENYVLSTEPVEVAFSQKRGGFGLMSRKPMIYPAAMFIGPKGLPATIVDVELEVGPVVMSLASMTEGKYPVVLRNDDMVDLT